MKARSRVHNKNSEGECLTRTLSAKITAYVRARVNNRRG